MGVPLILEDATENFDPMMEPLLGKNITTKGSMQLIKLGEDDIEYSKDFRFYITTKLSKPHYSPEICVKVTMLNFMVTEGGLKEQMLTIVLMNEDRNNMLKRQDAIIKNAQNEKKKADLENIILDQIANSGDNILEDDVLLQTLDESKT
jgi:dynein heavy chain